MEPRLARSRAQRTAHVAALLGTSSLAVLAISGTHAAEGQPAGAAAAAAAADAAAAVEEVLITGSLISGAPAIGLPVTTLGEETFVETGALNITEMLETMPGIDIPPTVGPVEGGGTLHFASSVNIHNVGEGDTLMMLDGYRWPLQGYDGLRVDPAIFPQIAVARTDVLTAGASATYGADAAAGVINVILKRGYDGAQTIARYGNASMASHSNYLLGQLVGRTWDSGGVTVAYEFQKEQRISGAALPWNTLNFGTSGFEGFDYTRIAMSEPGVVSIGATTGTIPAGYSPLSPDRDGGRFCTNCFALPEGIGWNFGDRDPQPVTSWAAILAEGGVKRDRIRNPWHDGWSRPEMESNSATITFDQTLVDNLNLFGVDFGSVALQADGYWSNRRYLQHYPTDQGQAVEHMPPVRNGYTVPTNNPYRPTGAPANLRIHFNLGPQLDAPLVSGGQQNDRWLVGLNFDDLPFDWNGHIHYSQSENFSYGYDRGGVIPNMVAAALGNTIASAADQRGPAFPALGAWVKPAGIPYLNPFCDGNLYQYCNSPLTIAYISGYRNQSLRSHVTELHAQIDGPVFELPGGPILAAIAVDRVTYAQRFLQEDNTNSQYAGQIIITGDNLYDVNDAIIGQVNIPVFGEDLTFPLMERLDVEVGYRYDTYKTLDDPVWTPKVAVNWMIGWGLGVQASWGKSFRTPKGEQVSLSGASISSLNVLGGNEPSNSLRLDCQTALPAGAQPGTAIPGSLTALLNPTCNNTNQALFAPAILSVGGTPILVGGIIQGSGLAGDIPTEVGPQKATQYNIGVNFTPGADVFGGMLEGLSFNGVYWNLTYKDLIGDATRGTGPNDPLSFSSFIVRPNLNAPITDPSNAAFFQLVRDLSAVPTRQARAPSAEAMLNIMAIQVGLTGNLGRREMAGFDFTFRYDWEMANWGNFHVGATGNYVIRDRVKNAAEDPGWTVDYGSYVEGRDIVRRIASGNQLQKVRYRAGWTDADGTWSVTSFFTYYGHSPTDLEGAGLIPPCFYQPGFGPGSCYPGSPYYGPYTVFPTHSPANVLVDLSIGYQTGDTPANPYLKNIGFNLTINNVMDKKPPLGVHPLRSRGTGVVAYDRNYNDLTREFSFTVTKLW